MDPELRLIQAFGHVDEGALARARQALRELPRTTQVQRPRPAPRRLAASVASHLGAERLRVGEDLLRALLEDQQHEDGCLWFGPPRFGWDEAWARWVVDPGVSCAVPGPGEEPATLAWRVLETLMALGLHSGRVTLWRARLNHVRGRHGEAATAWQGLERSSRFLASTARIDLASAALERGDLRGAATELRGLETAPGAVRLRAWIAAAWGRQLVPESGGPPEAHQVLESSRPLVPAFLVALRDRRPELAPQLAGVPRRAGPHGTLTPWAALVAGLPWAAFRVTEGRAHLLASSAGAAGSGRLLQWAQGRGDAVRQEGDPACAVIGDGVPRVLERGGTDEASTWIDPASRAAALVPLPQEAGVGWVRIEWAHAPTICLQRLAGAVGRAGFQAMEGSRPRASRSCAPSREDPLPASPAANPALPEAPAALADLVEPVRVSLLGRLPSWTVRLLDASATLAAPEDSPRQRILARCHASGIVLQHRGEAERRLDGSALRGVHAPVPGRGRGSLVLVLESRAPGEIPAWLGPEAARQAQLLGRRLGEEEFRRALRRHQGTVLLTTSGSSAQRR